MKKFFFWLIALVLLLGIVAFGALAGVRAIYPQKYSEAVLRYSEKYSLSPALVFAVIKCESGFDSSARSNVDAIGLMQITRETFDWAKMRGNDTRELVFDDLFDPEVAIEYGCHILSLLTDEFVNTDIVLAAYHAGWGTAKQWLGDESVGARGHIDIDKIPYPHTKAYVKRVTRTEKVYEFLL